MFGLITKRKHEAILAKADRLIDEAAQHVASEEFSGVKTLPHKVALAIKRLDEARSNAFRNRQMILTLEGKLKEAEAELAPLKAARERQLENLKLGTAASAAKRSGAKVARAA